MSAERPEILEAAATDRAYRDDLTGLFNYRLLAELFEEGWDLLADDGALSLVILDLDLFKDVNDTFGHQTGNRVLVDTAELLRRNFRQDDILIRYGGDEFVILCPGAVHGVAERLAHRARESMGGQEFRDRDTGELLDIETTFSVGLASFPEDGRRGEEVLEAADRRLLRDKVSRHRARRSRRSLRERLLLPALGIPVIALLLVMNAMMERWSMEPLEIARPLPRELLRQELVPFESREVELQGELERLRAQIADLLAARRSPESTNARAVGESEELILAMQSRIEALERELASAALPGVEEEGAEDAPASEDPSSEESSEPSAGSEPRPEPPVEVVHIEESEDATTLPPRLLRFASPRYPPVARRMRREATITLRLTVDSDGRVLEAVPIGPTIGLGFETVARRAAMRAVFEPGHRDGVAVTSETTVAVKFRLVPE